MNAEKGKEPDVHNNAHILMTFDGKVIAYWCAILVSKLADSDVLRRQL